jgi:hypothetical protein
MITTEPKKKKDPFLLLCRLSYSVSYRSSGNETVAQINVPSRDNHRIVSRSVSYRASVHCALRIERKQTGRVLVLHFYVMSLILIGLTPSSFTS